MTEERDGVGRGAAPARRRVRQCSILDLAFGWLLAHDVVASVIAGATKPEQVRANAATADFSEPGVIARIDEIAPLRKARA